MKNKILIYGDANLNIIDGSSVWIVNLAQLLAEDKNNIVDVLLKAPITNDILVKQLSKYKNIKLLNAGLYFKNIKTIDYTNFPKVLKKIDKLRDYSLFIVRGKMVVKSIINTSMASKMIPYLTDFCHDSNKISNEEKEELLNIYNSVHNMFVQTKEMQEYLEQVLKVDGQKFSNLSPIVFSTPILHKEPKTIVYAGKIAKNWYIEELLDIMDKLYKICPEIKLYFIGNKFNSDLAHQKQNILTRLKNSPNITYIEELSKEDTYNIIGKCCLGYGFRSPNIDNDNSLEISIKFLEYSAFQVPSLLRETKMYKKILGNDYPLFVNSTDDAVTKILNYFKNDNSKILNNLKTSFVNYNSEQIYLSIKEAIYSYKKKKLRLLISGHDLKFIKPLFPYFAKDYELTIQELKDYRKLNKKESKKMLLNNDIIWCEWLLLNAAWYSKHIYPHQSLFIRAHRFEIEKNYGYLLNLYNVDKIITVSYYYYEEFLKKYKIPRQKITVINNFVETQKYSTRKDKNYQYNLALIGAVPALKGLDKAIDVLLKLLEDNQKYKLYVAGKKPEEWPNSWNIKTERTYYQNIYEKIAKNNLADKVIFTGWIDNKEFLKKIGYVLSTSTIESFHLAPLEAMASKSLGVALSWPGVEYIYPKEVICNSPDDMVKLIKYYNSDSIAFEKKSQELKEFVFNNYDIDYIYKKIQKVMD